MKSLIYPVYSSVETLNDTYDMAIRCLSLEGVFIECGIAAGSQLAMMAQACVDNGDNRKVIGFDSFCGIPFAGEHDAEQPALGKVDETKYNLLESSGVSSHDLQGVRDNFDKWKVPTDNVYFVKGWFQDTIPTYQVDKIALLRLDGDLYESTKVCLEYFYKKVVKGGIIIIDDYHLKGCQKAVHEYIKKKDIQIINNIAYVFTK